VTVVAFVYVAAGVDPPQDAASFDFTAGAAQDFALVAVALLVARSTGRASARQFGFRRFRLSAFGWALLALISYFILSAVYSVIVHPKQDDLLEQLGADRGTLLAVVSGVFVIGIAPVVEEFFFRGFLYQSLRTRLGVIGGAVTSGLIFGAVHLKLEFLVPLAILGILLALLFQKTNSLWPCILVHALNNALVFAVTL
jgi:membrane protease YdiL (CAAX protease family)